MFAAGQIGELRIIRRRRHLLHGINNKKLVFSFAF
jgi:hypothetical protein